VAHEVGNPLAAVVGYVDLLDQGVDSATATDIVRRAKKELQRIHITIQALLGYARTGSGQAEDVQVGAALDEAVQTVQPQLAQQNIQVQVQLDASLPSVWLERDKLHQILVNLLLNAAAASPVQNIALCATCFGSEMVEIRCEDDGCGFDDVALERAFEPFFTTKDVGAGTGLVWPCACR